MTEVTWSRVARALLGSWPERVASWGEEGIAAYVEELQARGVTAEQALVGIRSCPAGQVFPPSAPELAAVSRRDPAMPTFEELFQGLYGPGGVFGFKRSSVTVSPWVVAFADGFGRERLRMMEVDDPEQGHFRRRELEQAWARFVEACEGRELAQIADGRRGQLGRLNPASVLNRPAVTAELGSGS